MDKVIRIQQPLASTLQLILAQLLLRKQLPLQLQMVEAVLQLPLLLQQVLRLRPLPQLKHVPLQMFMELFVQDSTQVFAEEKVLAS